MPGRRGGGAEGGVRVRWMRGADAVGDAQCAVSCADGRCRGGCTLTMSGAAALPASMLGSWCTKDVWEGGGRTEERRRWTPSLPHSAVQCAPRWGSWLQSPSEPVSIYSRRVGHAQGGGEEEGEGGGRRMDDAGAHLLQYTARYMALAVRALARVSVRVQCLSVCSAAARARLVRVLPEPCVCVCRVFALNFEICRGVSRTRALGWPQMRWVERRFQRLLCPSKRSPDWSIFTWFNGTEFSI